MTTTTKTTSGTIVGNLDERAPELTIPEMFQRTASRLGEKTALLGKVSGNYQPTSYRQLAREVRDFALGLHSLEVRPGDRVAILSENRPEWAISDLAITSMGAVNVPLYSTLPPAQVQYVLGNAEAKIVICSSVKQLEKVLEVWDQLPDLQRAVLIDEADDQPEKVLSFNEVLCRGSRSENAEAKYAELTQTVKPQDLCSIIYTSGTTGQPKGALLTHDNFISNVQAVAERFDAHEEDVFLSFLPLSHVFERLVGHYFPLYVGATIAYAESVFTVQSDMAEIHPTVMSSVPRLYESIQSRILDRARRLPSRRRKIFEWALQVAERRNLGRVQGGRSAGLLTELQYQLADRLVLRKLRDVMGGRLRLQITGGAPLPLDTATFFSAIGMNVLEGYGLTETSPVICANKPGDVRFGTVGPPLRGIQVKIAEDGEILSRGPHIMQGYHGMPEATAEAIDADGWFHTGDIGELDEANRLRITGRKKDIIVLANGKNVAPQPIEGALKASPFIAEIALYGDRHPTIVALVVPAFDHLRAWAREQELDFKGTEDLVSRREVRDLFKAEMEARSEGLADFERVRRFCVLPREFSMQEGELTPTLKLRRQVVREHFASEIEKLFGRSG